MNYIEQIKGFWIAQEAHQLGTSEIALYFYLLEVCNKSGWAGTFNRNNYKVMADLSIRSYKTLQSLRDKLSNAGVLVYVQKNGEANVNYKLENLGKKYLGEGKGSVEGKGKGEGKGSVVEKINQTKPNQTSKSHSGGDPPAEPKKITEPFWEKLVETWFCFYGEKFKNEGGQPAKPAFNGAGADNLKKIVRHLKKMTQKEWTEEYSQHCLQKFLLKAYHHDQWMKDHFELGNMLTKFNSITNKSGNETSTNRNANHQTNRADLVSAGQDTSAAILRESFGELEP